MCHLKSTREGFRNGVGRHERMKRGRGMKDRDSRSRGIEIHTTDDFTMIKPTVPFKLANHTGLRKQNWSDSFSSSLAKTDVSRRTCRKNNRMKSSYKRPVVSSVKGMKTIGCLSHIRTRQKHTLHCKFHDDRDTHTGSRKCLFLHNGWRLTRLFPNHTRGVVVGTSMTMMNSLPLSGSRLCSTTHTRQPGKFFSLWCHTRSPWLSIAKYSSLCVVVNPDTH